MAAEKECCYTLISNGVDEREYSLKEIKEKLEKSTVAGGGAAKLTVAGVGISGGGTKEEELTEEKIRVLKYILRQIHQSNATNSQEVEARNNELLIYIIRYLLPIKSKKLKKLLYFYWEISPKFDQNGNLKSEFILVCNAIRNDLQHANEFIQGITLKFLCKLRHVEILELLIPVIRSCLEHPHPYVRKNAVLTIYYIYKNFDHLIPDAPELIQSFLVVENDPICKRNAFVMLANTDLAKAVEHLLQVYDEIPSYDEHLQLATIEVIRKDFPHTATEKENYLRCIGELLQSQSHAVKYEAATSLVALTSKPAAVRAAAGCLVDLVVWESDNNVKLIVLDRVRDMLRAQEHELDDLVFDLLRVLASPDIDVRKKALHIATELLATRNVRGVVAFLKKELSKTLDTVTYERNAEYRRALIKTFHTAAIGYPDIAADIVHALMEFLAEPNNRSAVDVVAFIKEVVERFPQLRAKILHHLLEVFPRLRSSKVLRGALWIIGTYATEETTVAASWKTLAESVGSLQLSHLGEEVTGAPDAAGETAATEAKSQRRSARLLADGTYATESAVANPLTTPTYADRPIIRELLLNGDYFLGSVLATCLTKLVFHYRDCMEEGSAALDRMKTEAMAIIADILRFGQKPPTPGTLSIDEDAGERMRVCLAALDSKLPDGLACKVFSQECRTAFTNLMEHAAMMQSKQGVAAGATKKIVQPDEPIKFGLLAKATKNLEDIDEYEVDLVAATRNLTVDTSLKSKLARILQLTGYSDPVYAETYLNVHQFDIVLDMLVVNQTRHTLQNLTVEFTTTGDLQLVEKPGYYNLAPYTFYNITATVKVSSTESGIIFGNIVYDGPGGVDTQCIVLNEIHIDILDYIKPAYCSETQFRNMWTEFEWENKVNISVKSTEMTTKQFAEHLMQLTNMQCLTPLPGQGDSDETDVLFKFLSANLYAKSVFGEDALANLSLEKEKDGKIVGHIRIRSKTQGIALGLGDKITNAQKAFL